MELIMLKLGGSLITDKSKPFTERIDVIERLAQEIHEAKKGGGFRLILGHGGGSYPHQPATEYQTHEGLINENSSMGLAIVQDAASKLNRIVVDALINRGENAISLQPSASCIAENKRITEWYTKPIEHYLSNDILPVVYGDVGVDTANGCCILSTEEILNFLAKRLGASRVIMCGKTDGVFTADPNMNPDAREIAEINNENFQSVRKYLTNSDGIGYRRDAAQGGAGTGACRIRDTDRYNKRPQTRKPQEMPSW